jgi:hypothetical protein
MIVEDLERDVLSVRRGRAVHDGGTAGAQHGVEAIPTAERSPEAISSGTAVDVHSSNVPANEGAYENFTAMPRM